MGLRHTFDAPAEGCSPSLLSPRLKICRYWILSPSEVSGETSSMQYFNLACNFSLRVRVLSNIFLSLVKSTRPEESGSESEQRLMRPYRKLVGSGQMSDVCVNFNCG
ncbi:hypothetical protein AAMO2058_001591400 [Amorphochlora amoebiformis]